MRRSVSRVHLNRHLCESDPLWNGGSKVKSCATVPFLCASKYICLNSVCMGFVLVSKYAVQKTAVILSKCSPER